MIFKEQESEPQFLTIPYSFVSHRLGSLKRPPPSSLGYAVRAPSRKPSCPPNEKADLTAVIYAASAGRVGARLKSDATWEDARDAHSWCARVEMQSSARLGVPGTQDLSDTPNAERTGRRHESLHTSTRVARCGILYAIGIWDYNTCPAVGILRTLGSARRSVVGKGAESSS